MAREILSPQHRPVDSNAFSTRDMNISLATSVSSTMHFGNPLSQLASDATTPRPRSGNQFEMPNGRSPGHQKSQSLHFGVGLGEQTRGLASPFRPTTTFHASRAEASDTLHAPAQAGRPSLAPPVELHAPMPRRSYFKRPAQSELEDALNSEDPFTRQTHLKKELYAQPAAAEPAHRRVRSRGFSLGDMSSSSRLSNLFSPQPTDEPATATQAGTATSGSFLQPPPAFAGMLRLGSPFAEKTSKQHFNTFPRNFSLSGLEPAMEIHEEPLNSHDLHNSAAHDCLWDHSVGIGRFHARRLILLVTFHEGKLISLISTCTFTTNRAALKLLHWASYLALTTADDIYDFSLFSSKVLLAFNSRRPQLNLIASPSLLSWPTPQEGHWCICIFHGVIFVPVVSHFSFKSWSLFVIILRAFTMNMMHAMMARAGTGTWSFGLYQGCFYGPPFSTSLRGFSHIYGSGWSPFFWGNGVAKKNRVLILLYGYCNVDVYILVKLIKFGLLFMKLFSLHLCDVNKLSIYFHVVWIWPYKMVDSC
jgi:hypothetical protein